MSPHGEIAFPISKTRVKVFNMSIRGDEIAKGLAEE
jgi:hypothetical protein